MTLPFIWPSDSCSPDTLLVIFSTKKKIEHPLAHRYFAGNPLCLVHADARIPFHRRNHVKNGLEMESGGDGSLVVDLVPRSLCHGIL